jgi:hypothetical protein
MSAGALLTLPEYDEVRAYVVLSHAEVEQFFEDCVATILAKAARRRSRRQTGRVDRFLPIAYRDLLARSYGAAKPPLQQAIDEHNRVVTKLNHGIALSNLARLFGPLGLDCSTIDPQYVADLETLRALRGQCAHSGSATVTVQPNPSDARRSVQNVVTGFDNYLEAELLRLCP